MHFGHTIVRGVLIGALSACGAPSSQSEPAPSSNAATPTLEEPQVAATNPLIGTWHDGDHMIVISQEGEQFLVTTSGGSAGTVNIEFLAALTDGKLPSNTLLGDVAYLQSQDTVLWAGRRYSRVLEQ